MTKRDLPTRAIAAAVNVLCGRNERTSGAVAGEMILGERSLIVFLKRPVVVEGQCWDVEPKADEVDILDLMDDWQHGRK